MQQGYLKKAKETFRDIDIETMELFDTELKGIDMFRVSGGKLFGDESKSFTIEKPLEEEPRVSINTKISSKAIEELLYPKKGKRKNIFFSGKGGVGKTSMACITAVEIAQKGFKTLLMTTDPAAHIGNVLEKPVGDTPTKIDDIENLYALKVDQKKATEEYKEKVLSEARKNFNESTVMAIEEELSSPCTEEMAAFQKFIEYASGEDFEVIVFDTEPTGHTLRLLDLPMDWSKQLQLKAGESTQISEEDRVEKEKFDRVIEMMKDEESTTFGFVMYPEKTPIIEAYRASKELQTVGIKTQLAVANLVIPEEEATTTFFKNRRAMQMKYLKEINERFNDARIIEVPMYDKEIKGLDILKNIAKSIF